MSVYIERYIFIESGSSGKSTPGDWVANAYSGQNDNKHKLRDWGMSEETYVCARTYQKHIRD